MKKYIVCSMIALGSISCTDSFLEEKMVSTITQDYFETEQGLTKQMPLPDATYNSDTIYHYACKLFDELWNGNPIRLLGVRTGKLSEIGEPMQMDLFSYNPKTTEKQLKMSKAMDAIRKKYGDGAITKGIKT